MPGCHSRPTPAQARLRAPSSPLCDFLPFGVQRAGPALLGWSLAAPGTLLLRCGPALRLRSRLGKAVAASAPGETAAIRSLGKLLF